jgi:[ribosomal protein S5]-alanine N-acetyltransferase
MVASMHADFASAAPLPSNGQIAASPGGYVSPQYPVLATERLRLRGLLANDCARLAALCDDCGDADTAVRLRAQLLHTSAQRWIGAHVSMWALLRAAHWAITCLDDDRLIGYLSLSEIDLDNRRATLSFRVGYVKHRHSFALEASQAALAFAFTDLGMQRVSAFHRVRHPRAAQILTSLGLRSEGLLRQYLFDQDQFEDVMLWAILRSEWTQSMQRADAPAGKACAEKRDPATRTQTQMPRLQG